VSFELQTLQWPAKRAILLVHGIGNAAKGDYVDLLAEVKTMLGEEADSFAIYQLWYDQVNDWFMGKTQLGDLLSKTIAALTDKIDDSEMGPAIAESMGDILWPVLSSDARAAVREAYLAQVKQMVLDGINAGVPARRQKLSIICHSLGCLHTYEALHHMVAMPNHGLHPVTNEVVWQNVVFMASPVQLIRTVSGAMGNLVPNKRWLYAVQGDALSVPSAATDAGRQIDAVKHWVSITGDLDPVGGFFFKNKADWAYMDCKDKQDSHVDDQSALNITSKKQLVKVVVDARREKQPPTVALNNPHSWENYVKHNATNLHTWLCS
jgi:hypothetical protein